MSDAEVALVHRIENVRFTPVRIREGYAMSEVDQLLDDCVDALRGGRPLRPLIDAARFRRVKWREGYDVSDVDSFLDELRAADRS